MDNSVQFLHQYSGLASFSIITLVLIVNALIAILLFAFSSLFFDDVPLFPIVILIMAIGCMGDGYLINSQISSPSGNPEISNIQFVYHKSNLSEVKSFNYDPDFKAGHWSFTRTMVSKSQVKSNLQELANKSDLQEGDVVKAHVNNVNDENPSLVLDSIQRLEPSGQYQKIK